MHRKIVYFLLILTLIPVLAFAGTKGRIKGKVVDLQTGEPLIGANVIVVGTTYGASTNVDGEFVILNLDAGVYEIKASYLGYKPVTIQNIRVNSDLTTYVDFELPSEDITTEEITIVAKKPLIKKDATSSVRIANSEDIKNLPVRGINQVISIQAGVVNDGGIRVRGSRTDEVGYYLEGVSITSPFGGRGVTIANDAIEEVQVETGGFSAEYGGANGGIVRTQLRSGGSEYHASLEYITDNVFLQSSKDDFLNQEKKLGTWWHGYNETSFVLGGPVPFAGNKFRFFYNLNYYFERTGTREDYPGFDYGPTVAPSGDSLDLSYPGGVLKNDPYQSFNHAATITMDLKPFRVRLGGTVHSSWDHTGSNSIATLNRERYAKREWENGTITAKVTHVLSDKMYYEVTGGYTWNKFERYDQYLKDNFWAYGDSVANANAGVNWVRTDAEKRAWEELDSDRTRYLQPQTLNIYGFAFAGKNSIPTNYMKSDRNSIFGKIDFSLLAGKHHSIKIGGEYNQHTMRSWWVGGQSSFAFQIANREEGTTVKEKQAALLYQSGVDNYGYDIYGNETDEDGFYAPHKPVFAAFYIQDKIEYSDIILNIGLRYDYIDIDNLRLKDPTRPELAIGDNFGKGELDMAGFEEVPSHSYVSPRLSVSFPVTDKTVFHATFGKFVQQPDLGESYIGYHYLAYQIGGGFFFSNPQGLNVGPTRKTHYEIGFRQQLTDFMAVDISGYYDDIKGQVFFDKVDTDKESPYQSYNTKANGDFATTKGVEVQLTMRRYKRLAINASLSFQDARGTGSFPNSNAGIVGAPLDGVTVFRPQYVSPLSFNRDLSGVISFDYRFGKDDGPSFLHEFGVNILATFDSGHPFTRGTGGRNLETDARDRRPLEPLNASLTPSTFNVDLKIDKTFSLFDELSANVYFRVLNLFDARNVQTVYKRSGAADDDGYISNPELGGKLIDQYGPVYADVYKSINIDYNGYYSAARQILFGIRLEY